MLRRGNRWSPVKAWWRGSAPQRPMPVTRGLSFGLPAALIAGILSAPAAPAVAAPVSGKPAKPVCPAQLPDENAALVTARMCGGPVPIAGLTTETDEAVATPTGAVQLSHRFRPVRVRRDGQWVPVDTTLAPQADGTVAPTATATGVVFSGGGTGPMVTISTAGKTLKVGSPVGALPTPQLDPTTPDTATYPDVLPGVDLQLRADVDGYAQVLVVKDRQAAANPKLAQLRFALSGTGLTTKADKAGNLRVVDGKGHLVWAGNTPLMWDATAQATTGNATAPSSGLTKAEAGRRAVMATTVAGSTITVRPNAKVLTDPATVYPVYLDPGVTANRSTWAQVDSGTPNTVYWNGTGDAQVGTPNGGTNVWHSYFTLDLSTTPVAGTYISAATLNLNETWSGSCTAKAMDLYATSPISSATTWNNQPGTVTWQSQATVAKGFSSSCPAGTVTMDATDGVRTAAASSASVVTLGLAASDETDSAAFKKFSNNPTLTITYTAYPSTSALSTSPSTPCVTGSGRPYVNTATPLLQARITDPEGASVRPEFSWSTTAGAAVGSAQPTPGQASGQLFGTTVPAGQLANGSSYAWKVRGFDTTVWGAWSASCEFTVDTTAPTAAPSVSSTTYPSGSWAGATGTAGTFTLGASGISDVASYRYGLDTDPNTTINASTLGGTASLSLTPAADGPHSLKVQSQDRAGNLSSVTTYSFNVGTGAVLSPHTGTISAGKVTLQAQGPSTTTGVTFQWRRGDNDAWTTIPATDVVLASGGTTITWPVATSGSGNYPNLVWSLDQTVNNAEDGLDPLDGPLQVRASLTGNAGTSSAVRFTFDRDAAAAATQDVGPGVVNLLTGNLTVSDTDVSIDAYGSDLTVGRSYSSRQHTITEPANMFGPGWTSSVLVDTADVPYTDLIVTGSLVQVGLPDGDTLGFTGSSSTTFVPEVGMENLKLTYDATNNVYTITDQTSVSVDFTHITGAPTGTYQPTTITLPGSGQKTTITWAKMTIGGVDLYRPTRVLAPIASGVNCTAMYVGCRALDFAYATSTTATGTNTGTWGDYLGRLREITFTAWDPDLPTPAMRTVAVADYAYDISGKLRSTWDPRLDYTDVGGSHHVADTYSYISDGLLATITPAGQEPWQLTYTTIPGDSGSGRLASVSRSALSAGTATTTVVYKIPTDSTGPADLSAGQTARWGQTEPPVDATAIYPATQVPDGNQATGVLPSSAERATIYYLNADGRQTNVADPSSHIDTDIYDKYGNTVRHLDGSNLEEALNASSTDTTAHEATLALRYSTINTYSADGQQLLDTVGPEHDVVLPDWSTVKGRTHTHNVYDQGAPSGGPYNLVTTSTTTVRYTVNGVDTDTDARTTTTDYNWTLRQPITKAVDPSGLNLTTRTAYDATTGLVTSNTTPEGGTSTTTPATRTTVYYRAGYGSGYTECDYRPEWANLPCRVQPGGQPSSGAQLPVTVTTYDMYNQPRVVTEKTSTTTLRTTTTTYDTAGRPYDTSITASGLGTSLPTTRRTYDQATGQLLKTQSVVSGSVTAEISRAYDTLGRLSSYTDADGVTSTTTYDILGRTATTTDGKATRTYTYDGGTERRGLLTQVVDSQTGTFTASYDGRGNIAHQTWPTGVTTNQYYDETGEATGIEYLTNSSCTTSSCTLYTNYIGQDAHGLNRWDSNTLDSYGYTYDNAGRLVDAAHTTTAGCILREYTFDTATNRTKLARYGPEPTNCADTTLIDTKTSTYDNANRITNTGYTYDALGRTLTIPGADTANNAGTTTVTYHVNDLVDTITQSGRTTDYTIDVNGRRVRSWTDTTTGSTAHRNHYDGDDDTPSWTQETTTTYTRPFAGVAGMAGIYNSSSASIDYQVTNLHGDAVATIHNNATGLSTTKSATEYGIPNSSSNIGTVRYGWLGSKQRAADTPAGIVLMGARLYNSMTGRFLQVDPVYGGNANAYEYCKGDPVNCLDLKGLKGGKDKNGDELSDHEKAELHKKRLGYPHDAKAVRSAHRKLQNQQKHAGTRNKQKRDSHYRIGSLVKSAAGHVSQAWKATPTVAKIAIITGAVLILAPEIVGLGAILAF